MSKLKALHEVEDYLVQGNGIKYIPYDIVQEREEALQRRVEELESQNEALMNERSGMVKTHRENLEGQRLRIQGLEKVMCLALGAIKSAKDAGCEHPMTASEVLFRNILPREKLNKP